MRSFVDLAATLHGQPLALGPILARVDVGRGREQLYGAQVPELLRVLADSTRVASITASSAIEGVVVEPGRARRLLATGGTEVRRFRNRSERELAGYRDAMDALTRAASPLEPLGVPFLCHLHRLLFGHVEGGGGRLKSDPNMIVAYEGRRRRVIFEPPGPAETPFLLGELCARYEEAATATAAHPLLLVGLAALDLLAIHPFADGNGRVGRMATTHLLLRAGYGVPRYVSVEQRIFDTKAAYYDALEASQRGWRDGDHDPWPWLAYLAGVLADAYDAFEGHVARRDDGARTKQERVRRWVLEHAPATFTMADVRGALPGVSDPTLRLVLVELRDAGLIASSGAGRGARWTRRDP